MEHLLVSGIKVVAYSVPFGVNTPSYFVGFYVLYCIIFVIMKSSFKTWSGDR